MQELRMDRRKFLIAGTSLAGSFLLAGCGGWISGSGSKGSGATNVTGTLVIPPGLAAAELRVITLGGVTTPDAASFTGSVSNDGPTWATVIHEPTGKLVAFGLLDKTTGTYAINPAACAEALIFMSLGGMVYPADGRKALLDTIKGSSATGTLAGVIDTLQATDPFALETSSATLVNALAVAANGINLPSASPAKMAITRDTGLPKQLLIEPSTDVDGITVVQATDSFGFQVQNNRRRVARIHPYLVAHVDAEGVRTDIEPQAVGNPVEIPSTFSLLNLGQFWRPVTTNTVPLTLQNGDTKSIYELVYLCPTYGEPTPDFLETGKYLGQAGLLEASLNELYSAQLMNLVGGIILDILGVGGLTAGIGSLTATIANLSPVSTNVYSLLIGANGGSSLIPLVQNTLNAFLGESLAATPSMVSAMQPILARAEGQLAADLAAGQASAEVYIALRAVLRVALAVGVVLLFTDLGAVALDTSLGNSGSLITATVFQPTIALNPASRTYQPGSSFPINVVVPSSGLSLKYRWKLEGSNLANLSDGTTVGNDFESTSPNVTLATTPSTVGDLVVTVTVRNAQSNEVIGTVSATYPKGSTEYQVQVVELPPSQVFPNGHGYVASYFPVPLKTGQTTLIDVECKVQDEGTLSFVKALPAKSTPVPLTQPATSAMSLYVDPNSVSVSNVINQMFINNHMAFCPLPQNYGDQCIVVVRITPWDARPYPGNNLSNAAEATAKLRLEMEKFEVTVQY